MEGGGEREVADVEAVLGHMMVAARACWGDDAAWRYDDRGRARHRMGRPRRRWREEGEAKGKVEGGEGDSSVVAGARSYARRCEHSGVMG